MLEVRWRTWLGSHVTSRDDVGVSRDQGEYDGLFHVTNDTDTAAQVT